MEEARRLVAWALAERAKRGVKVRQPLAKLVLREKNLPGGLRDLVKEEINVKEIVFDAGLPVFAALDWEITPELEEEGAVREIIRQIQELRKSARFTPADKIAVYVQSDGELGETVAKNQLIIAKETKSAGLKFQRPAKTAAEAEIKIGGRTLWLGVKKC